MYLLKLIFPFHLVGGLIWLSNSAILASDSVENTNETVIAANKWAVKTFGFNLLSDQFQSVHLIFFICYNCLFMGLIVFNDGLNAFGIKYLGFLFKCCRKFQ